MCVAKVREVLRGKGLVKGKAGGVALVTKEPICFLGGVDVSTGLITEPGHELYGQSIAGKILVFPTGKGSTGGSYLIYEAARNGTGPKAVINVRPEQVTVVGCIMAEIPMVADCDRDPTAVIASGDFVEVDADEGIVVVEKG